MRVKKYRPNEGPAEVDILRFTRGKFVIDAVEALILDLIEWVGIRERTYEEVMDAWRTSCPRLPVWEDANDCGLITTEHANGRSIVRITAAGLAFLEQRRPSSSRTTQLGSGRDAPDPESRYC